MLAFFTLNVERRSKVVQLGISQSIFVIFIATNEHLYPGIVLADFLKNTYLTKYHKIYYTPYTIYIIRKHASLLLA
jgi:hypothetical protein